ncbi:MAG: nucleotidyl transferase AbiEii/AbiGii toxin family protein [Deltaproteobacteria bacterium]|nr:nucleotidyl transferase AbiEii/AbiGii toxin family protein [Deltaproteobacteria bacterium]
MNAKKKSPLHLETLPPQTAVLFKTIASLDPHTVPCDLTSRLFLAGGTALSLQIGHRISNDLDLACVDDKLPTFAIEQFIELLKKNHRVQLITPAAQVAEHKIRTGLKLLDYVRDYSIDNVKVTFFLISRNEAQRALYQKADRVTGHWMFPILGLAGLKFAKTLVLAERQRSRDLVDLMFLFRDHGYSLPECSYYVENFGTNNDFEFFKAVMRGEIPLDKEDEAYRLLHESMRLEDVYSFFREKINAYEVELARQLFSSTE